MLPFGGVGVPGGLWGGDCLPILNGIKTGFGDSLERGRAGVPDASGPLQGRGQLRVAVGAQRSPVRVSALRQDQLTHRGGGGFNDEYFVRSFRPRGANTNKHVLRPNVPLSVNAAPGSSVAASLIIFGFWSFVLFSLRLNAPDPSSPVPVNTNTFSIGVWTFSSVIRRETAAAGLS